jgi:hypothetical protein
MCVCVCVCVCAESTASCSPSDNRIFLLVLVRKFSRAVVSVLVSLPALVQSRVVLVWRGTDPKDTGVG